MKTYRVTKVDPMSSPGPIVNHKILYSLVFRATPEDVTLKFDNTNVIRGFREMFLDSTEHLQNYGIEDVTFAKEFAATPFGGLLATLAARDKYLLSRAIGKLSPAGKKALRDAVN